jgi:hypothetical protein
MNEELHLLRCLEKAQQRGRHEFDCSEGMEGKRPARNKEGPPVVRLQLSWKLVQAAPSYPF